MARKTSAKAPSSNEVGGNSNSSTNRVFRISLTAVYNNISMDEETIADGVFEAMTKVGKGLALLHVDSVKSVAKADEAIVKILSEVSGQTKESMASRTADDGKEFVAVDGKAKAKGRKKNER